MSNSTPFDNCAAGYWPYQSPVVDRPPQQVMYPKHAYLAHQPVQPSSDYTQQLQVPELAPTPSSLLETILRHGRNAVPESYANSFGKPPTPPGGHCRLTPPYTPTSTSGQSPVAACMSFGQVQETSNDLQGYQNYSQQPLCNGPYVQPHYGAQPISESGYQDNYNVINQNDISTDNNYNGQLNPAVKFTKKAQVDYAWMKSNGETSEVAYKRTRQTYTRYQTLELEKDFHFSRYLNKKRRKEIAESLCLTERQIKIWFQNRRMKAKKKKSEITVNRHNVSTGQPASSMNNQCAIQTMTTPMMAPMQIAQLPSTNQPTTDQPTTNQPTTSNVQDYPYLHEAYLHYRQTMYEDNSVEPMPQLDEIGGL